MFKNGKWLTIAAVVFWASAIGLAQAVTCPPGTKDAAPRITGPYKFTFAGSQYYDPGNPVVGTGTFISDGHGNITRGTLNLNCFVYQSTVTITGGCYSLNADGTGFMSLALSDYFCTLFDLGVDLDLAVNNLGILFASDASDLNFVTGEYIPFSGAATNQ